VKAVVYQQLSGKVAATIFGPLAGGRRRRAADLGSRAQTDTPDDAALGSRGRRSVTYGTLPASTQSGRPISRAPLSKMKDEEPSGCSPV